MIERIYVHEFLLSLHQHCFLDKKAPRTTLTNIVCNRVDKGIWHQDMVLNTTYLDHLTLGRYNRNAGSDCI